MREGWRGWSQDKRGSWHARLHPKAAGGARLASAPRPERRGRFLLPKFPPGPYRDHREAHGCWPGPCPERERLFREGREAGTL